MNRENPFKTEDYSDRRDQELIAAALEGDQESLSKLLVRHQPFIYNIALKMINHVEDAEDVTQEILIKLATNLGRYHDSSRGRFRTWLYRVTFNHIMNLKKQKYEQLVTSFGDFFNYIDGTAIHELSDEEEAAMQAAIEESKVACMAGMLMCLDRTQRLVYVVGEIFEIDHHLASEIFEITPDNFRQKLSRVRKDLYQWMNNRCGLVNKRNSCRCPKKTKGFIANGWVNPEAMKWHSDYAHTIAQLSNRQVDKVLLARDEVYAQLFREHPFKNHHQSATVLACILDNQTIRETLRLDADHPKLG